MPVEGLRITGTVVHKMIDVVIKDFGKHLDPKIALSTGKTAFVAVKVEMSDARSVEQTSQTLGDFVLHCIIR